MHGVQQRLPSIRTEPIAFAHRGARAHAPENTIDAFALALRLGANGLETDVWVTADNQVVLDHDGVVRRFARNRPINELTSSQLPAHIPTLQAFFEKCGTSFDLSIDIKDVRAFEPTVRIAKEAGFDLSRLWLCHHKLEVTLQARSELPDVRIVDSSRLHRIKEGPERRAATLAEHGVDCLNMHFSDWTGGLTTLVHKFGLMAFGWDAQYDYVITDGLRMGLDAVYSDHVDTMVDAYSREIGHVPRC